MSIQSDGNDAMPLRRRDLPEWRRERILDSALNVFGSKGVDAASMKEVAAAAGVAPGLLYHYFAGKDALALAVVVERAFLPDLRKLIDAAGQRPAAVILTEVMVSFDGMLSKRGALVGLFVSGAANPNIRQEFQEKLRAGNSVLARYLSDRVAAGELRPHDSHAVVHSLFSAILVGYIIGQPINPITVVHLVLEGITASRRKD